MRYEKQFLAGWYDYTRWKAPLPPRPRRIDVDDNTDDKTLNEGIPSQKQPENDGNEFVVSGKICDGGESGDCKLATDQDETISILTESAPLGRPPESNGDDRRVPDPSSVVRYPLQVIVLRTGSPSVAGSQSSAASDVTTGEDEWVPKPFDPHAFAQVHAPHWANENAAAARRPPMGIGELESASRLAAEGPLGI
ncbi:hypothetical protein DFQ27_000554 [Actinomortierella ambigua]|uniref:Uncharacterized protein n=1 Tax=Actinomortierella ambigua TaxID=1343610 RepID=A0A9P6U9X9_9FUNG|nr:hypothetical protein DFQ27_000554 [Actinomortierella ambigua]